MIERLLAAGYPVAAYNRTRAKLDGLVAAGATATESIARLASLPVVFTTVSSSDDLMAVTLDDGGLLAGVTVPRVVVDCSTVSVESSATVRARAIERGVEFLAAPVSGNPGVVRSGRLTFAVSGPRAAYDWALPILDAIGSRATYVGEGESARLVKLCHNLFLGAVIQSLVEVTLLAEKGGVPRGDFLAYINNSVLGSTFTGYKTPALVELDFHPTFTSRLLRKDMDLGLEAASGLGVSMPVALVVRQMVDSLVQEGYGEEDFASLIAMQAGPAGVDLGIDRRAGQDDTKDRDITGGSM
jgi:3-hydroxyisobutyrate dehydrogenase-like beta-hydroxyacid dehydrogenase